MVQRLSLVKPGLQKMVVSKQWQDWVEKMSAAEKAVARGIEDQVLDNNTFWSSVNEVCTVMQPVFLLMRELEGDEPNVASVYAAASEVQDKLEEAVPGLVFSAYDLEEVKSKFLAR
jgi:hypothetical protein